MSQPRSLSELKSELTKRLADDPISFQEVIGLTAEIAKLEPGVVRFTTDAAMVRRLGRELVAKKETALAELVKNAYDADATSCTVIIEEDAQGTTMQIIDDGSGMSRSDIEDGFMRLASDSKVLSPVSKKYRRARAGKKGIGRFATERLGARLQVITQVESEDNAWTVSVDWDSFVQGHDLNIIPNVIVEIPKERSHGTRIIIEGLSDSWSESELRRVYRYLSTLLEPMFAEVPLEKTEEDPGFAVHIFRNSHGAVDVSTPLSITSESELFGHAVATIEATVDSEGQAKWSLKSEQTGAFVEGQLIGLDRNKTDPLKHARDARMKAYYFIQSRDLLGPSTGFIKEQLNDYGGIRLYRNGYRVPPYGEQEDDWLGLDAKRTNTYAPLNSKTFLGFVALVDLEGSNFEETSSREGLIETDAFREIRDIMSAILEAAVRRIESARGKGRRPTQNTNKPEHYQTPAETEAAATTIEEAILSDAVSDALGPVVRDRLISAMRQVTDAARQTADVARERDDLLKELNLLRILASMGLTIAEFTHDFSHLAATMELNTIAIKRAATTSAAELDGALERFENQFQLLRGYISHFGNMMTNNASRHLQFIDLYAFARSFRDDMSALFDRRRMLLEVERPAEYEIYTTRMHPSEWSSILLNLLTNAIKATNRARGPGNFLIRVGVSQPGTVFLDFCDNGDGIPIANRALVFDAFFTTTGGSPARASDIAQAVGTGLGLKIVADIVNAVGGKAEVIDPPAGYSTCIRITVPAGTPPTMDADGND